MAGITKLEDFKLKLPIDQQIIMRALTAHFAPDAASRTKALELLQVEVTGGDASGTPLQKQATQSDATKVGSAALNARTSYLDLINKISKKDKESGGYKAATNIAERIDATAIELYTDPNFFTNTDAENRKQFLSDLQAASRYLAGPYGRKTSKQFNVEG